MATSTIKEFTDLVLKHFNFDTLFDEMITAKDVTKGKPDPQIFNLAVERLSSLKNLSVVFEDSKNGIASAKSAEIFCVGILTKGLNDDFVQIADYVIEDYSSILNFLE